MADDCRLCPCAQGRMHEAFSDAEFKKAPGLAHAGCSARNSHASIQAKGQRPQGLSSLHANSVNSRRRAWAHNSGSACVLTVHSGRAKPSFRTSVSSGTPSSWRLQPLRAAAFAGPFAGKPHSSAVARTPMMTEAVEAMPAVAAAGQAEGLAAATGDGFIKVGANSNVKAVAGRIAHCCRRGELLLDGVMLAQCSRSAGGCPAAWKHRSCPPVRKRVSSARAQPAPPPAPGHAAT